MAECIVVSQQKGVGENADTGRGKFVCLNQTTPEVPLEAVEIANYD